MANMGYCRFRNTLHDLLDCEDHMNEELQDSEEMKARERLLKVCQRISENYGEADPGREGWKQTVGYQPKG